MSPWRALSLDLDGTLLSSEKKVSDMALRSIQELHSRGFCVIVSTARPLRAVTTVLPPWFHNCYWAVCNGAWVLRDGAVICRNEIPHWEARHWLEVLSQHGLWAQVEANDTYYSDRPPMFGFPPDCPPLSAFQDGDACKLLVTLANLDERATLLSLLPDSFAVAITDDGALAQISQRSCGKLQAVQHILALEGMDMRELVAFGDDNNDVALLAEAGLGVAVRNATPEVLRIARMVVDSNDADGVGRFLEDLLRAECQAGPGG